MILFLALLLPNITLFNFKNYVYVYVTNYVYVKILSYLFCTVIGT